MIKTIMTTMMTINIIQNIIRKQQIQMKNQKKINIKKEKALQRKMILTDIVILLKLVKNRCGEVKLLPLEIV